VDEHRRRNLVLITIVAQRPHLNIQVLCRTNRQPTRLGAQEYNFMLAWFHRHLIIIKRQPQ
jgi:hypothetical protein